MRETDGSAKGRKMEKPSLRSLMGILATPNTPDWDYEELQGHIREIRDAWKASTYAILEEDAE